jgi:hypothetical protein
MEKDELISMLRKEARQAGIPDSEASKAARLLRKGKIDMGRLAPHIAEAFSSMTSGASRDPRESLRKKLRSKREARTSKAVLDHNYERMREQVNLEREERKAEKVESVRRDKRHRRKLREMEASMGEISIETYLEALRRTKANEYKDKGDKCRDMNIIELYGKQQSFGELDELDELDMTNAI